MSCDIEGCGKDVLAKGLCSRHYYRQKRGGNPQVKSLKEKTLAERFWEKVDKSGACWEWKGSRDSRGYGSLKVGSKMVKAHRTSWEMHRGPLTGEHVLHKCDNPSCVNPDHLFIGTHTDNMQDMKQKGRLKQRNNVKLKEWQVGEIRKLLKTMTHRQIAFLYKVSKATITAISTGRNWRD